MNELLGEIVLYFISCTILLSVAFCSGVVAYTGWKKAEAFWIAYRQVPDDLVKLFHTTEAGKSFGEFCRTHPHIPRDHVLFQRALERHIDAYYSFQLRHPRIAKAGYIKMYLDMRVPEKKCHLKLVA